MDILLRRGFALVIGPNVEKCNGRSLLCSLLLMSSWDYVVLYLVVTMFKLDPYAVYHGTVRAFREESSIGMNCK